MKHFSRYKRVFFAIIMLLLTFLLSIPAYTIYTNTKVLIEKEIGKTTMAISVSVAEIIAQDIESYKKLNSVSIYEDGNYDIVYYLKMQKIFQNLKKTTNMRYIYTEKKISNTQTMYIFDGEPTDSEFFSPLGSVDVIDRYKLMAYETKMPNQSPMENYPIWGELISGYAPILDPSSGEVLGLVGTDYSSDQISYIISYLKTIIILSFVALLLIIGFGTYKIIWLTTDNLEMDYLTGLSNKSYFEYSLKACINKAKRKPFPFSVIMMDIDNFKETNDNFGHHYGDLVLKNVSQVIRDQTRNFDICARYGGDEFICLLPGTSQSSSMLIAERIKKSMSEIFIFTDENERVGVALSMGVYEYNVDAHFDEVIKSVDAALYQSKGSGKDKITLFNKTS